MNGEIQNNCLNQASNTIIKKPRAFSSYFGIDISDFSISKDINLAESCGELDLEDEGNSITKNIQQDSNNRFYSSSCLFDTNLLTHIVRGRLQHENKKAFIPRKGVFTSPKIVKPIANIYKKETDQRLSQRKELKTDSGKICSKEYFRKREGSDIFFDNCFQKNPISVIEEKKRDYMTPSFLLSKKEISVTIPFPLSVKIIKEGYINNQPSSSNNDNRECDIHTNSIL